MNKKQKELENVLITEVQVVAHLLAELSAIREGIHCNETIDVEAVREGVHATLEKAFKALSDLEAGEKS